jgi:L-lysine exporter family protein LysE/ArgO
MFINGFFLSFTLIAAIGPQNAFVIRQGLKAEHVFLTALLCAFCDSVLILIGVLGAGQFLGQNEFIKTILTLAGVCFLVLYGAKSFYNVTKKERLTIKATNQPVSRKKIILQGISFSWLNPHAILDTVVIIGSVSAQYTFSESILFGSGAIIASLTWFFLLAYCAKKLSKYFQVPLTWKIIDFIVGIICFWITYGLLKEFINF